MRRLAKVPGVIIGVAWLQSCASSSGAPGPSCEFTVGGFFQVSRDVRAAYSITTENSVPQLRAIAIVKYDVPVRYTNLPEWLPPPFPRGGVGGSIDTLMVVYDEDSDRMWLHTRPIDLEGNNVLLVDRNASGDGEPQVIRVMRIDPVLYPAPLNCDRTGAGISRALGTKIEQTKDIRDFVQSGSRNSEPR